MAKAHTCYTIDVLFLNSVSLKLGNHHYCIVRWRRFSYALLRNALTQPLVRLQLNTDTTTISKSRSLQDKKILHRSFTIHPTLFQNHKSPTKEMLHTVLNPNQRKPLPTQHFIPSFSQPPTELSLDEKYPPLIHTQPLVLGQVYRHHADYGSATPSPSTTRCSSSTLALCDDHTRKIFTSCGPGPDRMMTPPPVCEKRERLMTRELLMMSAHTYPYAAPFYAVNQSWNGDDERHKDLYPELSRPPPPPLEVAPYRSLQRMWKKHFTDGLEAQDLPIMGYHARRLVHCNCIWDEDELMDLSRAFVWRASECGERPTNALAALASEVHHVFRMAPWMGTDENFRRCLWDVTRETFVSSWHFEEQKTSRQAVTYIKDPSPGYMRYVVSALSICSFIGDLFRYDFISRPDAVGCIRILMHNLTTVEHITAISSIIKHAGVPLWREAVDLDAEVWEFRKVLLEKSKPLKDYRTVLLQPIDGNTGVRSKVDGILGYVEDCRLGVADERRRTSTLAT